MARSYVAVLSNADTKQILSLCEARAADMGVNFNLAVVDGGGHLLGFSRMDGATLGSIEVCQRKAVTAALFRAESGAFGDVVRARPLTGIENFNGGLALFKGGVPIVIDDQVVGGLGVAGGTAVQDLEIAEYALERFYASL
ncbi:GlcG/HbpS family heme-binding protein [Oceanobacter mangrovi]|uniref:GlcG/HbpS family heme-binding protein n=1 Tax=Oceanobacter mangrovi TaxID=2862510 RepID=UPI001C8E9A2B|nr:heme-binding protein [Oceanobacter mangrovi]